MNALKVLKPVLFALALAGLFPAMAAWANSEGRVYVNTEMETLGFTVIDIEGAAARELYGKLEVEVYQTQSGLKVKRGENIVCTRDKGRSPFYCGMIMHNASGSIRGNDVAEPAPAVGGSN